LLLAVVVYNRGITNGLRAPEGNEINLSPRRFTLPFGSLDLTVDSSGFSYGGYRLAKFVSVDDFEIRGFRNRYRKVGIGASLSARFEGADSKGASEWIPPKAKVPVTAFVRFVQPRRALDGGESKGTLELYNVDEIPAVRIGEYSVPLDFDPSVSLAYRLEGAPVWDFEIAGFRKGNFRLSGMKNEGDLFFINPYRPGKIPVVFVHGTASSPARWAEMANEFLGDPRIASRYQFWVFIYNTGNPVALSAMYLREGLEKAVRELDPSGKDPSLLQMVVIGHSQGGLLTKMTVVESGSRFWDARFKVPFEQAKLPAETRDLLRRSMFVEPLPFVKRVVFIATPHRGSFLAENFLGKIARKLISLPGTLTTMGKQLTTLNPAMAGKTGWRIPTAIDNMDWSNPFLRTLASLPMEGVKTHSIIAVKGDGPPEKGNDGVVRYTSAHIEGVESELVVRSPHSCQSNPHTIEEVRRILYEHAGVQ
jgi:pimeloyl-ACP methyl ester carboxylesterase